MKKLYCVKVPGAPYQPSKEIWGDNFCIYPFGDAVKARYSLILGFLSPHNNVNVQRSLHLIVSCLQFLFPVPRMKIYHLFNRRECFEIEYIKKKEIIPIIANKINVSMNNLEEYPQKLRCDFKNLTKIQTNFEESIDFLEFYNQFKENFSKKGGYALRLYLHSLSNTDLIYNNIFHQITLLQIIFDYIVGKPKYKKCKECHQRVYNEKTSDFQTNIIKEMFSEEKAEDRLSDILKLKFILNKKARIDFVHAGGKYRNNYEEFIKEIQSGKNSNSQPFKLSETLEKNISKWTAIEWDNVFIAYSNFVRKLIYKKYFASKNI